MTIYSASVAKRSTQTGGWHPADGPLGTSDYTTSSLYFGSYDDYSSSIYGVIIAIGK